MSLVSTFTRISLCPLLKTEIDVASEYDSKDPTSSSPDIRQKAQALSAVDSLPHSDLTASSLEGLRIGIPQVLHYPLLISTLQNNHLILPGVLPYFYRPVHSYSPSASADISEHIRCILGPCQFTINSLCAQCLLRTCKRRSRE